MRESWDRRIHRAEQLAAADNPAASLLHFYAGLLRWQRTLADSLADRRTVASAGSLPRDLIAIRAHATTLLRTVSDTGPDPLVLEARRLLAGPEHALDDLLLEYWRDPSDRQFFAKATLQPYAQWLRETGVEPVRTERARTDNRCPFCGGAPQLSVLQAPPENPIEGGGRSLLCSMCLSAWPFRRVLCPHCAEDDERQLGYFQSPAFDHIRLDVCETCHHYLKTIDLTRCGLAVPIVDEVAAATFDLWAREHGYEKIELNLVGL